MNPPVEDGDGVVSSITTGDFVYEILIRVPAIRLSTLKLVCKDWRSIISSKQFRRLHTLHHRRPPPLSSIIIQIYDIKEYYLFYIMCPLRKNHRLIEYKFPFPSPKILSTCNGLMLIASMIDRGRDFINYDRDQFDCYVYNITTNQSRRLVIDCSSEYRDIMGMQLAFDPSKSIHYTIVMVRGKCPPASYRVEVYDSESCSWKVGSQPFTTNDSTWMVGSQPFTTNDSSGFVHGFHCNGLIYWIGSKGAIWCYDISKRSMAPLCHRKRALFVDRIQVSNRHVYFVDGRGEWVELFEIDHRKKWLWHRDIFMLYETLAPP